MENAQRVVATETVTAKIDGINTVVAEAGQPVPVGYEHLVPESKKKPLGAAAASRSTSGRRAAAAARAEAVETASPDAADPKAGRGGTRAKSK